MSKSGYAVITMYGGHIENIYVYATREQALDAWYVKLKNYFKTVNREFLTDTVENASELLGYLDADDQARFTEMWLEIHEQILDGEREEFIIKGCDIHI